MDLYLLTHPRGQNQRLLSAFSTGAAATAATMTAAIMTATLKRMILLVSNEEN
jgi:hypothetical protein